MASNAGHGLPSRCTLFREKSMSRFSSGAKFSQPNRLHRWGHRRSRYVSDRIFVCFVTICDVLRALRKSGIRQKSSITSIDIILNNETAMNYEENL
eukprot:scaffold321292_cov42-Attheya_sp.AAC.2